MSQRSSKLTTVDAWSNALSGFGLVGRDRGESTAFDSDTWLDDYTLGALFHHSDIAARIVSLKPSEALRQGVKTPKLSAQESEILRADFDRLGLLPKMQESSIWGRLYGGGLLALGVNDGRGQHEPADWAAVKSLDFVRVFDRRDVQIDLQRPWMYRVQMEGGAQLDLHASRAFRFGGALTGDRERRELAGWDASVLQRCFRPLRAFEAAHQAIGTMLGEASIGILTMKGLLAALASNMRETILKRAALIDMTKWVGKSILLDADAGESYRREPINFASVPDTIDRTGQRLSAAAEVPLTLLLGVSPAGLNATGASDIRWFYDTVKAYQTDYLLPKLSRVVRLLLSLRGIDPAKGLIEFPPLWQESPSEEASRKLAVAQTDQIYWTIGAATDDLIRRSRFRPEGYSVDMLPPTVVAESLLTQPGEEGAALEERPIPVTPTDVASVVTVNELRASIKLAPLPGPDGALLLPAYHAKYSETIAAGASALQGDPAPPAEPPAPPAEPPAGTPAP